MKLTRRQLRRLINEAILLESAAEVLHPGSYGTKLPLGKDKTKYKVSSSMGKITKIEVTSDHKLVVTGKVMGFSKTSNATALPSSAAKKIKDSVNAGKEKFSIKHSGIKVTFTKIA